MPDQRRVYSDVGTFWREWKNCQGDPRRARELEDTAIRELLSHRERQDRPERALDATGWMRCILLERAEQTLPLAHTESRRSRPGD